MRDNLLARETYLSADNNIKKYISQNSKKTKKTSKANQQQWGLFLQETTSLCDLLFLDNQFMDIFYNRTPLVIVPLHTMCTRQLLCWLIVKSHE